MKTVFTKYFELDNGFNFENIEEFPNNEEIYSDVLIPFHISKSNLSIKYIGHRCCYGCITFMSSLGYEFWDVNSKFKIYWKSLTIYLHSCPEKINSVVDKIQLFAREVQKINNFENILPSYSNSTIKENRLS